MFNTSFYEKWVEKYGKEEADKRKKEVYLKRDSVLSNLILKYGEESAFKIWNERNAKISKSRKNYFKTNPDKKPGGSYYEKWVEKYGKEEADFRMKRREERRIESLKRNKQNKL